MKNLARIVVTGTSCAATLLSTFASASRTAAAVGTSGESFGAGYNRANSKRHLAVESLPHYIQSNRDDFVETADLPTVPADLHGFRQSDPAGGLSSLRGGQQEEVEKLTGEDEPIVVLHDIFDRFDQVPELAARKGGGGGGSSRSKGSKGSSGSGSASGKGYGSKGSKGGSSSNNKSGTKSSKGSSTGTNKSSSSNKKSSPKSSSGNKKKDDDKKSSSDRSSSKSNSKNSSSGKTKSVTKKTNSQRMCSTSAEKTCRNKCIDNRCDASDDESSPCAKRCRYKCCSDMRSDDRSNKNGKKDDDDEERSCNTMEEKSCRSKCFYKKKCRDDECKRQCRRDCCVGGRIGSGSKTKKSEDKKKSGGEGDGSKEKEAGADGEGENEDGKGCDTDDEKQCRDTCYIESSCQNGDRECRKTCRQGCCDVDLSIVDVISNAQEQNADDDGSVISGDIPLSFRFTINTAERFTADDIMNARDNSLKEDLEGGLRILVEDVVGEAFRGDGWKEDSRRARRRKLIVRYQSDSPPTVEDVQDVACPSNVGGSGCKRVRAEATLELEDENESSVREAFLSAISEAISNGRLESAIRQFNPDHGSRDPFTNNPGSSSDGGDGKNLTNIQIAGIAVGALAFVVISYLALKICQDRRRRKEERSIQGSSAPGSVSQQEARYEDDAYHDAYGGDHYEEQRLPPIPEPPQLPERSSGKPRESKLAAVRRELQDDPYEPHTPERMLEAGGPSLVDLVATSYTPNITKAAEGAADENFDSAHQPSELSDDYYDGVQPSERAGHGQQSENTLDQDIDHEPTANDYGPPSSPHRYDDGGQGHQGDRLDLSAPIDFSQQAAGASGYADDQDQAYGENDHQDYPNPEYVADDTYQQGEEYYDDVVEYQQGEEYHGDDAQYQEQPMATDSWGERKHASQYDYQGGSGGGYDEEEQAPPEMAESDISSKEGDAMTETSSQKFIETAKRMAAAERDDPRDMADNDAVEDISDRSDDEEAHSQARAYRHRAQAERIGRKSRVSDLINRFESS